MNDEMTKALPLQYEDGPDYCTVRDAQGRDFALTTRPALMKAMEAALAAPPPSTQKVMDDLRNHLGQALRQWKMYAEMNEDRDLMTEESLEATIYRKCIAVLSTNPGEQE